MRERFLMVLTGVLLLPVFACHAAQKPGETGPSTGVGGKTMSLAITTKAFSEGGTIPKIYTCDDTDASPDLEWSGAPAGVQAFALIADDPDAPAGTWTHWVIWNIPAQSTRLAKSVPKDETLSDGSRQGRNDFKRVGYGGPCPPAGKPHRYFFKLYALDRKLDLKAGASRKELEEAMQGHVLAQGEVMGKYGR
jgi:Raf kinase inhibitor-like YbhB/YbcL family protein